MALEPRRTQAEKPSDSPSASIRLLPDWYRSGRLALTAHDNWGDIPIQARDLVSTGDETSFVLVLSGGSYGGSVLSVGTALGVNRLPAACDEGSRGRAPAEPWLLSPNQVPFLPHPARALFEATVVEHRRDGPEVRVTCHVDCTWAETDTAAWPTCRPRRDGAARARQ
ncbi:hypothetical protein KM427_18885 [Nocardioides sp. LMS-CY]|uniref:hypothetical protein n=1 Tax=Nocardioides sp. (strain LMS-CY) TaxID=2840457 RepID=UPI001C002599|nr:hypothetical protein [Nocardioides sp. LMS-CY]QWF21000.1 hypothetical protein KM427_18885 [Nocardioides sp. LMS-CY]